MLSEEFFSSICGPPLASNTAVSKDVGIYHQSLSPYTVKATFKKSSAPPHSLAVSETHVFAAQDQKAHVHVYSRQRGNQEALVPFPERIRSLSLAGDVLVLGTAEGRLFLWEICTGRQVATPPCHVQAVSCLAVTPYHVLSGSDDSNINVWSLARLLEFETQAEHEPELVLSNHRGAITDLTVGPGTTNPETSICVSASRDKTCIIWNFRTGQVLRTLLFPAPPLCIGLDPCGRALCVVSEGGALHLVELFGDRPLLGSRSAELASIVVQVGAPLGVADADTGEASCLAFSYDGTCLLTGHMAGKILRWGLADNSHPAELASLNASVTNLVFAPLIGKKRPIRPINIVKPNHNQRQYTITAQLEGDLGQATRFERLLNARGFSEDVIEAALLAVSAPAQDGDDDIELQKTNNELWAVLSDPKVLQKSTLSQYLEASHGR